MTLTDHDLSALLAAVQTGEMTETGRTAQRNGHRPKLVATAAGDVELAIPKLRTGSFFPSILERRRRIDRALSAVVMEAYVHGVSTRKVDDLVKALGAAAGSPSRRCRGSVPSSTAIWRRSAPAGWRAGSPTCSPMPPTSRPEPGAGSSPGRWWSPPVPAPTGPARCWASTSATAKTEPSGGRSSGRSGPGDCPGCSWSSATTTSASKLPSQRCSSAPTGCNAGPISCATPWPGSPRARPRSSRRPSRRSSLSLRPRMSAPSSPRSSACCEPSSPTWPPCSPIPPRTSSPSL